MLLLTLLATLFLLHASASSLERRSFLTDCLSSAGVNPITSSSSSYTSSIAAFNQRIQPLPAVIVFPTSSDLVAAAVGCARIKGVTVSARGGGHSYASHGLGGSNGALVIDLSSFKGITVHDFPDNTAVLGGGARLGDIALAFNAKGRAMSHGVCPGVGIGGHAGLGGFGPSSRKWGLTVDNVIGYDVVLSNSTIVRNLTADKDPDLYWALKGSAPSFGIITFYYFRTYQAPSTVIVFTYDYPSGTLTSSQASSLFLSFQTFGKSNAPSALGLQFVTGPGGSVEIGGLYHGTLDQCQAVTGGFVAAMPRGYTSNVRSLSWIDSLKVVAGGQPLSLLGASDYHDSFFAKSLMVPSSIPLTSTAVSAFFSYLWITSTTTKWFVEVDLYGGVGSKINGHSLTSSSFAHRNKLLTFQMYASSPTYANPYPAAGIDFVNGMYNAVVQPMLSAWGSTYGAYVNYADPTLTEAQVKALYWGSQYARLADLKRKYDPGNVFSSPQSIKAVVWR